MSKPWLDKPLWKKESVMARTLKVTIICQDLDEDDEETTPQQSEKNLKTILENELECYNYEIESIIVEAQ